MEPGIGTLGIIGGSGMLGSAIARGLLAAGVVAPGNLWIANRSGAGLDGAAGVQVTTSAKALVEACDLVLLSVPPEAMAALNIDARGKLVVSVMAGVTRTALASRTGAERVVRAMSSPAAALGLAYSPWIATDAVTAADRTTVTALFAAIGQTDEVFVEDHIDHFTAMTGPVPGFVAYFASTLAAHAEAQGIAPQVADRAVRQLFLAAGQMMAEGDARPEDHVREMIDYDGTTAAGLTAMQASPLAKSVSEGLMAAFRKAQTIA